MGRVRLISGRFGGRFIASPDSSATHPMGERVRAAIFNILARDIANKKVLDAFAGSGAIGLEALSREADHVTFVERDRVAGRILAENITLLGVEHQTRLIKTSVHNWLKTSGEMEFDIIFADPPYHDPQLSTVKTLMGLLKVGGYMILSYPGRGEVPHRNGFVVVDNRNYANAHLIIFHREE